jgi:uncharacterized membrane protein YGL010W
VLAIDHGWRKIELAGCAVRGAAATPVEEAMRTINEQLSNYAAYHRDRRNIATHFVGIPMIVVAVATLLSRPNFGSWMGLALTPALVLSLAVAAYYLLLDLRFGLVMSSLLALSLLAGQWLSEQGTSAWLLSGIGLFVIGWIFQFVGHYYEGRKPAFVDDLMGLIIGPLFVVAETAFALGLRQTLRQDIERKVGPTHLRDIAAAKTA